MIKNERQYRITQAQAKKFEEALAQFDKNLDKREEVHPLLWKAQRDALQSQLSELCEEIEEYEALKSGQYKVLELESLEELPLALIKARIAAGLSQKELADRLGIKEQQIQRYEDTEYASASFTRLIEVSQALGIKVREDVFFPNAQITLNTLFGRLKQVGIERDFVIKRLLPQSILGNLQADDISEDQTSSIALRASAILNRIFGLAPAAIFSSSPLQLNTAALATVHFKVSKGTDERRLSAYTLYAHFLALLVLDATSDLPKKPIPTNPSEVREAILSTYGSLNFKYALHYLWSLGVPVLPLNDSGAFHGAFWRVEGRNIIVLKQQTNSSARWLSDVFHELWHAAQEPELNERTVIEDSETAQERRESPEEKTATRFSGHITLAGRAEELVKLCQEEAKGSIERLKKVVPLVATRENVSVASLANYMAFRLSLQGENWWGAATNLQTEDTDYTDPWQTARDFLLERADFGRLNEVDRNLLLRALSDI
ncbi:MAG: helix-turn-helix transcriptional regulator [Moorea sp. SIO2I5]|nr:helix-turn-helix transcriptional regulator [Moorena sp. SIO2I5]